MTNTATLTIIHTGPADMHASQHVPGIDATNWDAAVMHARDVLRSRVLGGMEIIAAELRSDDKAPGDAAVRSGAALGKVYQPSEWANTELAN